MCSARSAYLCSCSWIASRLLGPRWRARRFSRRRGLGRAAGAGVDSDGAECDLVAGHDHFDLREGGILKRLRATPLSPTVILSAHVLVKLLFTLITLAIMVLLGRRYFPPGAPASLFSYAVALTFTTWAILSIGFSDREYCSNGPFRPAACCADSVSDGGPVGAVLSARRPSAITQAAGARTAARLCGVAAGRHLAWRRMVCSSWRRRCADALLRRLHSDLDPNVPMGVSANAASGLSDGLQICPAFLRQFAWGFTLRRQLRTEYRTCTWRPEDGALSGHHDSAGKGVYPRGASSVHQERSVRYHAVDSAARDRARRRGCGPGQPGALSRWCWSPTCGSSAITTSSPRIRGWPSRRRHSGAIVSLRSICCS